MLSDRTYSVMCLLVSGWTIFYMLFMLIIVPILPLDENNILCSLSPTPILLMAGGSGLLFIGALSIFTLYTMFKSKSALK